FASNSTALVRFGTAERRLTFEESGYGVRGGGAFEGIYCDNGYVCLPCAGGNNAPEKDHPAAQFGQLYVYPVTRLKKPAVTLNGLCHWGMAFDHQRGAVYGTAPDERINLLLYNANGLRVKECPLNLRQARHIVVRPQGDTLLLLTDKGVVVVGAPPR